MIKLNFNKKFAAYQWEKVKGFDIYGGIVLDVFAVKVQDNILASLRVPIKQVGEDEKSFIEITQKTLRTPEQVEEWAQQQFEIVVTLLYNHYMQ
jgi:hypothetical protein